MKTNIKTQVRDLGLVAGGRATIETLPKPPFITPAAGKGVV